MCTIRPRRARTIMRAACWLATKAARTPAVTMGATPIPTRPVSLPLFPFECKPCPGLGRACTHLGEELVRGQEGQADRCQGRLPALQRVQPKSLSGGIG